MQNQYLLLDFDGTLFNTLYPTYQIFKKKLSDENTILKIHKAYISSNKKKLEDYALVWKDFLKSLKDSYQLIIISESSQKVIDLYLKTFSLEKFFLLIKGHLYHSNGKRKEYIYHLLAKPITIKIALISDSPKDLQLKDQKLLTFASNNFFSSDFCFLKQKLYRIMHVLTSSINHEKNTVFSKRIKK